MCELFDIVRMLRLELLLKARNLSRMYKTWIIYEQLFRAQQGFLLPYSFVDDFVEKVFTLELIHKFLEHPFDSRSTQFLASDPASRGKNLCWALCNIFYSTRVQRFGTLNYILYDLHIYLLSSIRPKSNSNFSSFSSSLIHRFSLHPTTDIFPSFLLAFNWFQLHSGNGIIEADNIFSMSLFFPSVDVALGNDYSWSAIF